MYPIETPTVHDNHSDANGINHGMPADAADFLNAMYDEPTEVTDESANAQFDYFEAMREAQSLPPFFPAA